MDEKQKSINMMKSFIETSGDLFPQFILNVQGDEYHPEKAHTKREAEINDRKGRE